tara:strand:- start:189 stop:377 length:189 start_codon:yes stop_codon:yes gene_type:complete
MIYLHQDYILKLVKNVEIDRNVLMKSKNQLAEIAMVVHFVFTINLNQYVEIVEVVHFVFMIN